MNRSSRLRRRTPLRPRREPRADPKRDEDYLRWIRRQACAACGRHRGIQAHHATAGRGLGQKAHDHTAVPLCAECHRMFHDGRGAFDLTREARAAWMRDAAAQVRARYVVTMARTDY